MQLARSRWLQLRVASGNATSGATIAHQITAGHFDNGWLHVDDTFDPGFFVQFLDASRARALEFARNNPKAAFAHLALEPGLSILDCGCGTGDMLALMAQEIAPGAACGGDLSSTMLDEARRRAATTGQANLRFETMDTQALPFPDSSFDRVLATQLLVHVPDPRLALHELCRVTARNGLVAIADMDWDSLLIGSDDRELGRRFTRLFADGIRNGLVVREYGGWLRAEGLTDVHVIAQPMVFDNWTFAKKWIIDSALPHFVAIGGMSAGEADAFVAGLAERNASGNFFAASTMYTVTARRA